MERAPAVIRAPGSTAGRPTWMRHVSRTTRAPTAPSIRLSTPAKEDRAVRSPRRRRSPFRATRPRISVQGARSTATRTRRADATPDARAAPSAQAARRTLLPQPAWTPRTRRPGADGVRARPGIVPETRSPARRSTALSPVADAPHRRPTPPHRLTHAPTLEATSRRGALKPRGGRPTPPFTCAEETPRSCSGPSAGQAPAVRPAPGRPPPRRTRPLSADPRQLLPDRQIDHPRSPQAGPGHHHAGMRLDGLTDDH